MKLRPFELVLVVAFGIMGVLALVLLSSFSGGKNSTSSKEYVGPVQIWGTLPAEPVNAFISSFAENNDDTYVGVTYTFVPEIEFDTTLTRALADGAGPDMILTSHESLVSQRKRIQPISYESFPLRDFQNNYIDGMSIFTLSDGVYSYPFLVDPLMMYWNTDLLANEGFLTAPATWEELVNVQFPALIRRDFDRTVTRGVVAMGEFSNARNSFALVSALMLQGGSQAVIEQNGEYRIQLQTTANSTADPLRNAFDFYLRFNKPSNALYSWNRSFTEDRTQFIAEDLVFYFGFGSEGEEIERLNPNLSFDIAEVPQGAAATVRRTYGKFYGLSVLRSADNPQGAFKMTALLGSQPVVSDFANAYSMVPAWRSLVSQGNNTAYGRFTYKSAPITYGWLNPEMNATNEAYRKVTSDISENRRTLDLGASDLTKRLQELY